MPTLTRRRDPDARQETWHVHYGDIRVATIAERVGNLSRCSSRECTHGTAASFEEARAAFEAAWSIFFANRTEADFETYQSRKH
jgi:hypothetical protein